MDFALTLIAEVAGEAARETVASRLQRPHPPAAVARA
jgi:hypothetical protein